MFQSNRRDWCLCPIIIPSSLGSSFLISSPKFPGLFILQRPLTPMPINHAALLHALLLNLPPGLRLSPYDLSYLMARIIESSYSLAIPHRSLPEASSKKLLIDFLMDPEGLLSENNSNLSQAQGISWVELGLHMLIFPLFSQHPGNLETRCRQEVLRGAKPLCIPGFG